MDIENMHPFCLPFGLCYDATSSSITNENILLDGSGNIKSRTSSPSDELLRQLSQNNNCHHNHDTLTILDDDSIFAHAQSNGEEDDIFHYSLELDLGQSDLDSSTTNTFDRNSGSIDGSRTIGTDQFVEDGEQEDDGELVDDWYSINSQQSQFLFLSPTFGAYSNINGKRKGKQQRHHQHIVFQHIVDPIDIKSSPTLAQLNLNANDDPIDGLWGEANATSSGSNNNHQSSTSTSIRVHHNPIRLTTPSSSTLTGRSLLSTLCTNGSSNSRSSSLSTSSSTSVASLQTHGNMDLSSPPPPSSSSLSLSANSNNTLNRSTPLQATTCNHHHQLNYPNHVNHQLNHHNHQQLSSNHQHQNHQHTQHQIYSTNPAPLCHHDQQRQQCNTTTTTATCCQAGLLMAQQNQHNQNNANSIQQNTQLTSNRLQRPQQKSTLMSHSDATTAQSHRPTSPALVTSSSSPLSSSAAVAAAAASPSSSSNSAATVTQAQGPTGRSATSNKKLKENIEYLTNLLCNGSNNKLDNGTNSATNQQQQQQQQQPPVAGVNSPANSNILTSTMVRSYATLAHSLSTRPKLLEHNNAIIAFSNNNNNNNNHLHMQNSNHLATLMNQQISGNEATPFGNETTNSSTTTNHHEPQNGHQPRWFQQNCKSPVILTPQHAVESSVSAADSTDCQVSSLTNCSVAAHQTNQQSSYSHLPVECHQHCAAAAGFGACGNSSSNSNQQRRSAPELKVLSSLLSTNRCSSPHQCSAIGCHGHQHNNHDTPHQQLHQHNHLSIQRQPVFSSSNVATPIALTNGTYNCNQWQDRMPTQPLNPTQQQQYQQHYPATGQEQVLSKPDVSIPANGKPITLTPLNQSNSIIINQQPQPPKPRSNSVFAQPASPSTSSTTSSGGCLEIASSSSSTTSSSGSSIGPPSKKLKTSGGGAITAIGHQHPTAAGRKPAKGRANRPNSMSTDCSLSSHDEGFSSQVDNDDCTSNRDSDEDDEDVDSDDESFYGDYTNSDLIGASISDNAENKWTLNMGRTRRNGQKRYFWQYNVQSKGPKGTRIASADSLEDPFVLPEASDPVFSNDCQVEGVKHSGKARRGDGNDLTPNPRKLLMIGLELKKLGKIINDLAPVTDLPLNARNKTRKEKNKLASRACRLKKKAQHEANKIKLYGLQKEHQQVVMAIFDIRKLLKEELHCQENTINNSQTASQATSARVEALAEQCSMNVAGLTSDYVNSVLEKVVSGCIDGGLQT